MEAGFALGQTAAPAPADPTAPSPASPGPDGGLGFDPVTGAGPSLQDLFLSSPIINGILAGLSIFSLLLFLYFWLTINAGSMAPSGFVDDVMKLVLNGKHDDAANLCRRHRDIFSASIMQRAIENAGKSHSVVMGMLDSEGRRRADVVWNRISYLADVANVAPMLGLLGTVLGMIQAFFGLNLRLESGEMAADVLSAGIGQAMATTMFGLVVAIVALVFYSITKSRATKALAEVEQVVHSVADHLKREGA